MTQSSLRAVTCISPSNCVAVGDLAEEATFNPANLAGAKAKPLSTAGLSGQPNLEAGAKAKPLSTAGLSGQPNLEAVACRSATQCTAVGSQGDMMTFNPSTLAIVKNRNISHPSATGFYDLACASTTVCVAGDTVGYMFEFNPTTGVLTTPKKLFDASGAQFNGIACASGTQCTAVNQVGIEYTFDPAALPLTAHHATLTSNADPLQGIGAPFITTPFRRRPVASTASAARPTRPRRCVAPSTAPATSMSERDLESNRHRSR